jgi:predicted enzyme related to lactoylglutathione lyase
VSCGSSGSIIASAASAPRTFDTAAARKAAELAAKIYMPPTDIPGIGRFCVLVSPQGVTFHLIKYVQA